MAGAEAASAGATAADLTALFTAIAVGGGDNGGDHDGGRGNDEDDEDDVELAEVDVRLADRHSGQKEQAEKDRDIERDRRDVRVNGAVVQAGPAASRRAPR